jgi:hypothetical protein
VDLVLSQGEVPHQPLFRGGGVGRLWVDHEPREVGELLRMVRRLLEQRFDLVAPPFLEAVWA